MMNFVFITDTHFTSSSHVRTGSVVEDLIKKLQFVVDYCNENDAILLHGGDFFDKPSVPDFVKNSIIPVLLNLKNPCYIVRGNHDILFSNEEFNYKTSLQTLIEANLVKVLDTVDLGEVILTSEFPLKEQSKPQIALAHGFLNKQDNWSVSFQDIAVSQTQTYLLLGHDHIVYEPLQFQSVKIFRPGSMFRQTRQQESYRNPTLLHIRCKDGKLQSKTVEIPCRPAEEVFKTKLTDITKAQQQATYDDIIQQIRSANQENMSLECAINRVAAEDVWPYVSKLLQEYKITQQHTSKNL